MRRTICFAAALLLALTRHFAGEGWGVALAAALSLAALGYCVSLDFRHAKPPGERQ